MDCSVYCASLDCGLWVCMCRVPMRKALVCILEACRAKGEGVLSSPNPPPPMVMGGELGVGARRSHSRGALCVCVRWEDAALECPAGSWLAGLFGGGGMADGGKQSSGMGAARSGDLLMSGVGDGDADLFWGSPR